MTDEIELEKLTDEQLAELREKIDVETYRRHILSTAADAIAEVIRGYVNAGGDKATLASDLTDALTTDA